MRKFHLKTIKDTGISNTINDSFFLSKNLEGIIEKTMKRYKTVSCPALLFLFISFFLPSCRQSQEQNSSFIDFGSKGMAKNVEYLFHPFDDLKDSLNSSSRYDICLVARYTQQCKLQSLPIDIEIVSLECDTIFNLKKDLSLFNKKGKVLGKGKLAVYETSIPLVKDIKRQEGYSVAVSTPEGNNEGIISIGILRKESI